MHLSIAERIEDIPADRWDSLFGSEHPFTRHAFLHALEASGSVTARSGWQPAHLVGREHPGGEIIALAPGYLKTHSYGEFVFDWAWADAYQRHGLAYYPKLLSAIPFTPVCGPRLAVSDAAPPSTREDFVDAILEDCRSRGLSSWHTLFPPREAQAAHRSLLTRQATQFHWHNPGYRDFQDFLDQLTSRKRKNIRKERDRVVTGGIRFDWLRADQWQERDLHQLYLFYAATYVKRGQKPYLTRDFFDRLRRDLPECMWWLRATQAGTSVAGALFFTGGRTLYGRYWGCLEEHEFLHFETCYYQGIERAISEGLSDFDAGVQGEHKLLRGFVPVTTQSWHWIADPRFRHAIDEFLLQEEAAVRRYQSEAAECLPYRQG